MTEELFKNITATEECPPDQKQQEAQKTPVVASTSGSEVKPEDKTDEEADDLQMPSELDMLKQRAKMMNIQFSNNIGLDALKAKVEAALSGDAKEEPEAPTKAPETPAPVVNALTGANPEKKKTLRQYLRDEKMKLIRVRITNLDPKKKDLPGEIITVANEYLGTVRKFVPFGEVTDNGYHIPKCIYDVLAERTFVSIKVRKGQRGEEIVEHQNAREFALEVLPQLTSDEIAKLAAAQTAGGNI